MKIPVLVVLPRQEALIESASERIAGAPMRLDLERMKSLPGISLDPGFAAVAVGAAEPQGASLESLQPEASERFVVRGQVEEEELERLKEPLPDGSRVFADPRIAPFATGIGDAAVGDAAAVGRLLSLPQLHQQGLDGEGVAVAICDTGINLADLRQRLGQAARFDALNSWRSPFGAAGDAPGQHPVGHGTMCAYNALLAAPQATLLDVPILRGAVAAGSTIGASLSVALQGYANLLAFWSVAFAPGGAGRYKALVISNSWGMYHPGWDFPEGHPGRVSDNPEHPFNQIVAMLARHGADVVFAAGNCGELCPARDCQGVTANTIRGSNALPEVLTLGGCDVREEWVAYSSQGPGIARMHREKPDLVAPTHFLGSEVSGAGEPDTGTSTSCPLAAGCVAALRSSPRATPAVLPPARLIERLKATARQPAGIAAGWNRSLGHGIIDPLAAATALALT